MEEGEVEAIMTSDLGSHTRAFLLHALHGMQNTNLVHFQKEHASLCSLNRFANKFTEKFFKASQHVIIVVIVPDCSLSR